MKKLTFEDVKFILGHKKEILESIREKRRMMYQELAETDDLLIQAAYPSRYIGEVTCSKEYSDLTDVYDKYLQIRKKVSLEQREILWHLLEEEETVHELWHGFLQVPEPFFNLLYRLYVENNTYSAIEIEMKCSHSSFERKRQKGLTILLSLYEDRRKAKEDGRRDVLGIPAPGTFLF